MDTFPVAPELLQAFPLGALNLLVAVASTVAAQHGVEPARRLCTDSANNDEVWAYIATRLGRVEPGEEAPNTDRTPPLSEVGAGSSAVQVSTPAAGDPGAAVATPGARRRRADETAALASNASPSDSGEVHAELAGESAPARARPRTARRRTSSKANGSKR